MVGLLHTRRLRERPGQPRPDGQPYRPAPQGAGPGPSYGLNYHETRFSQLDKINAGNVGELGLAWSYDLTSIRGVEATPLVVDGVMYVTGSWSIVHALDAKTGEKLWTYDPEVDRAYGFRGCCDVVNRGVALYEGMVYVGAYDGYLHAIDAKTGKLLKAPLYSAGQVEAMKPIVWGRFVCKYFRKHMK